MFLLVVVNVFRNVLSMTEWIHTTYMRMQNIHRLLTAIHTSNMDLIELSLQVRNACNSQRFNQRNVRMVRTTG